MVWYSHLFQNLPQFIVIHTSVVSASSRPHGLQPTRLLCLCNALGKNTGVGCQSLLQGIFQTQGLNLGLLHSGQRDPPFVPRKRLPDWASPQLSPSVESCGCKEKAMAPHCRTLVWRIPWMEEPGRLQSMGGRIAASLGNFNLCF